MTAISRDEIRGRAVVTETIVRASLATTLRDRGRAMSLPRYASSGPAVFLLHYAGRRLIEPSPRAHRRAERGRVRHRRAIRHQEPRRRIGLGTALRAVPCGRRRAFCSASSPATICCGGSPVGSRAMPSSPSAATSASSSSIICRATARAISPTNSPARSPAASPPPRTPLWSIENSLTWTTIPPAAAVVSSIAVLGIINWQMAGVALRHRRRCSAWSSPGAPRAASICMRASPARPRRSPAISPISSATWGWCAPSAPPRREQARLSRKIEHEMAAQRESLRSLERLRLFHALSVFVVTAGVLALGGHAVACRPDHHRRRRADDDARLHRASCLARSRHGAGGGVAAFRQARRGGRGPGPAARDGGCARRPAAHQLGGAVSFENVGFSYPDGERVLAGFRISHVRAGEKLGLVGRTGRRQIDDLGLAAAALRARSPAMF